MGIMPRDLAEKAQEGGLRLQFLGGARIEDAGSAPNWRSICDVQ